MAGRARSLDGTEYPNAANRIVRLYPLLLFLLAFLPRLVAIGRYITPDESIWVYRSILFREALLNGRWADTLVAGHPGVTTTWLGAAGMTLQLWLTGEARASYDWLVKMAVLTPENVEAYRHLSVLLSGGRVAVALVNSLGIVAAYWLSRRLWGQRVAMVAGLLLALDPFLVGLSGLLHVDGLSATFVILSLLSLAIGLMPDEAGKRSWIWMLVAGASAGLAVLTKTPTLLLLPVSGLAMLWPLFRNARLSSRARVAAFLRNGIVWGVAFLLVIFVLYPALWVTPATVLATVRGSANRHLGEALRETFFLGQVAFNHGPLFYPVVLLWRLSPVVWLAMIPVAGLARVWRKRGRGLPAGAYPALLLLLWVVLFLGAITPAAKKFDRYILPVVPALLILAAVAWGAWASRRGRAAWRILALVVAFQAIYWAAFAAYPLAAYNPLVGGPRTAAAVLPVGWGEPVSAAGRWLADNDPEAAGRRAMAGIVPALAPFFPGQTLVAGRDDPATAHYQVVTLGGRQLDPAGWRAQIEGLTLAHTVHYGGLDQAWIYQRMSPRAPVLPAPLAEPAVFGERMALVAYEQSMIDDAVDIAVKWRRLQPLAADERFTLRLVVRDDSGNLWAVEENDLLNEAAFFPPDWPTDETGTVRYLLELPPGIPPATYHVAMSLIDPRTAGQLPVRVGDVFHGVLYMVGAIDVPPPENIVSASRLQIPHFTEQTWLDGRLRLLGHGDIPAEALAGSELPVDLFWHVPVENLPTGLNLAWRWQPAGGGEPMAAQTTPLSRYDTELWRTGETIQEKYRVPLPPKLSPGDYELLVEPLTADGEPLGEVYNLGDVQVNNIDRLYQVDVPVPFLVSFESLDLLGLDNTELVARPGEAPELTLFWRKYAPYGQVYTVFIHLLDESGAIVQSADHWPGGLPTDILDSSQIVIDRFAIPLPADLPAGTYQVRAGLYSSESGVRLPAHSFVEEGTGTVGADFAILPLQVQVVSP